MKPVIDSAVTNWITTLIGGTGGVILIIDTVSKYLQSHQHIDWKELLIGIVVALLGATAKDGHK